MPESKYWVTANRAAKGRPRVISYSVMHSVGHSTEVIQTFPIPLSGGWRVALSLANTLRDDLNAGIK
jgi:hypothetical protein